MTMRQGGLDRLVDRAVEALRLLFDTKNNKNNDGCHVIISLRARGNKHAGVPVY